MRSRIILAAVMFAPALALFCSLWHHAFKWGRPQPAASSIQIVVVRLCAVPFRLPRPELALALPPFRETTTRFWKKKTTCYLKVTAVACAWCNRSVKRSPLPAGPSL